MTRDFKIGLISGVVLAFVALIWVVTRPTLSPQARMIGPGKGAGRDNPPPRSTPQGSSAAEPIEALPARAEVVGVLPGEPETDTTHATEPQPAEQPPVEADRSPSNPPGGIDSTIYERDEKITTTRFHIVRKNETLSAISQQYYGTPNQWQKIVKANPEVLKNPDKISPGTKLIIPK